MLLYNNVLIAFQSTETFDESPWLDPTGGDTQGVLFAIRTDGIIAPGQFPALPGETPTVTARRLEAALNLPRRELKYIGPDGVVWLDLSSSNPDLLASDWGKDDANGPTPKGVSVRSLSGGSYAVSFGVEVRLTGCPPNKGFRQIDTETYRLALSHRWAETIDYDREWTATKTRTGMLIVSSRGPIHPDDLRPLVTPGVPVGFRREKATYTLDPSGLRLSYTFVDKQLCAPPPYPGTKLGGTYTEVHPRPGTGNIIPRAHIRLTMNAPFGTPRATMLASLFQIVLGRFKASNPLVPETGAEGRRFMAGCVITESLDDDRNEVTLEADWQVRPVPKKRLAQAAVQAQALTEDGGPVTPPSPPVTWVVDPSTGFLIPRPSDANDYGPPDAVPPPPPPATPGVGMPIFGEAVGQPLAGSNPFVGIAPPWYGLANTVRLYANALNDPCLTGLTFKAGLNDNSLVAVTPEGTDVTLRSGALTPTDSDSMLKTDPAGGVTSTLRAEMHHTLRGGGVLMPSTKKGERAAMVSVDNGDARLTADWTLEHTGGDDPPIPDPESQNDNWQFLGGTVTSSELDVAGDGITPLWRLAGCYEYQAVDASKVRVTAALPPWLDETRLEAARGLDGRTGGDGQLTDLRATVLFPADDNTGVDVFGDTETDTVLTGGP